MTAPTDHASAASTKTDRASGPWLFLLAHSLDPDANRLAADSVRLLRDRGHTVHPVVFRADPSGLPACLSDAVLLNPVSPVRDPAHVGLFRTLSDARALGATIRAMRPKAVVAFQREANLIGMWVAWWTGVAHRVAAHRALKRGGRAPGGIADAVLGSMGIYSRVMVASHAVRSAFQTHPRPYRKRIDVIYPALPAEPADPPTQRDARRTLGLSSGARILLARRRPGRPDSLAFLLAILEALPKVQLVLTGDPDPDSEIAAELKARRLVNRVRLMPTPAPEDRAALYRAADLFVEPARQTPAPEGMLEACRSGLPVIAADFPVQREALVGPTGLEGGVLMTSTDPEAWADVIDGLLRDQARRADLGSQASDHARAYSLERMADDLERLLMAR